jgi:ubiquitin C-terminal hydrolase
MQALGIANLGSTCYLAATLQMLAHVRGFVRGMLLRRGAAPRGDPRGAAVATEVRLLLLELWCVRSPSSARPPSSAGAASVAGLLRAAAAAPAFAGFDVRRQNDAHELLCLLLEALPQHVGRLFEGQLTRSTRCARCGTPAPDGPAVEAFVALPVDVAKNTSVQECVDAYFEDERVEGWSGCAACGCTVAARRARVRRVPRIVIVVVKRFLGQGGGVCRRPVAPSLALDLSRHLDHTSGRQRHRLAAVVCHAGQQDSGHYVACARRPVDGGWCLYDDARVATLPGGVRDVPPGLTYMLAYELVD